jgi:polyisoprenyl-teichoic acid--peptidoglycan teichoic acid transferase
VNRTLRRMLGAAVAIVLLTVVAASTAAIETVGTVADLFAKGIQVRSPDLSASAPDSPTTILILGSDRRDKGAIDASNPPHSDTILLLHLDPSTHLWSEMSIPRDFYVQWKWHGQPEASKINYVYTLGGTTTSLHVIKQLLHIPINYVIDINFTAFTKIVDKLGCVYTDVDHLYYNPPGTGFATINVRPGYQPLCGEHALDYVRYRHDDNTFARDAREQAFLRDAKAQLGLSGLLNHANDIITALSKSVASNIHSSHQVAGLLETVLGSVTGPVNQIQFPNDPINEDGQDDQTATRSQIREVATRFLEGSVAAPVVHSIAAKTHPGSHAGGGGGGGRTVHAASPPSAPGLIATTSSVINEAALLGPDVPFPVVVPALTLDTASPDPYEAFSHYTVRDPQGNVHLGYRIDWSTGDVGSYYGIEGMNWTNPPLFANADKVDRYGRQYLYVNTGGKVQDVGWIVGNALYWVSNTIFQNLSNEQMFALAESASSAGG